MPALWLYLGIINGIAFLFFILDKRLAVRKKQRISENTLHLIELLGGVFSIIILIPVIRHKTKKINYWIVSLTILIVWIIALCLLIPY